MVHGPRHVLRRPAAKACELVAHQAFEDGLTFEAADVGGNQFRIDLGLLPFLDVCGFHWATSWDGAARDSSAWDEVGPKVDQTSLE